MRAFIATAAMLCGLQAACSLDLNWDLGRLACDPNGNCLAGYSCLGNQCVANNSRTLGASCEQQIQCSSGEFCTVSYLDRPCDGDPSCLICASGCDLSAAYTPGSCGASAYCSVFCTRALTSSTPPHYAACDGDARAGVCLVGGGCTANQACTLVNSMDAGNGNARGVCVSMGTGVTTCMQACSFDFNSTTNHDGCGSTTANNLTCQPVGVAGQQQMVCIPPIVGQELVAGDTGCNSGSQICSPGNACISGVCRTLCNTQAPSCGALTCTALTGLATPPTGINTSGVGYCH